MAGCRRGAALFVLALAFMLVGASAATAQTSLVSCNGSDWNCQTTELGPGTGALALVDNYVPCLPGPTIVPSPDSPTRLELCVRGGPDGNGGWDEPVVLVNDGQEIAVRQGSAIGHGGTCTRHNLLVRIDEQRVGLRDCS